MLTPKPGPTQAATPTPTPPPNRLPYDSVLTFVLDGTISSGTSKANDVVNAHLKDPIVINGKTVVPAGTQMQVRVLDAAPAQNPDIYGFVDIYFNPLPLPDGRLLPLRPQSSHLNVNSSAGHESTVGIENTVGDIFAPTLLLHVFRKGRNFTLQAGAEIHAHTQATLEMADNGTVAISTPPPLVMDANAPHSSFKSMPLATPNPKFMPQVPIPRLTPGNPAPASPRP